MKYALPVALYPRNAISARLNKAMPMRSMMAKVKAIENAASGRSTMAAKIIQNIFISFSVNQHIQRPKQEVNN